MPVSLNPKHADKGGGFLDDVVVKITEARFVIYDFEGKAIGGPSVCTRLMLVDEETGEAIANPQYFGVGNPEHRSPSDDGKMLDALKDGVEGLPENCNTVEFINSMIEQGFPAARLDAGDISVLDGTILRLGQVPIKGQDGVVKMRTGADGKEYPKTKSICTEIVQLPGVGKKNSKKAAGKATTGAAPVEAEGNDIANKATEVILSLLADEKNEGSIRKSQIVSKAFPILKAEKVDGPTMNKVTKLAMSDDFLKDRAKEGYWKIEGGVISTVA